MKYSEYLKPVLANTIRNQVGMIRHDPFAGTGQASFTARCRKSGEMFDAGENCSDKICCSFWIIGCNVRSFVIQIS